MFYVAAYLAGVLWAAHRYGLKVQTRNPESAWTVGLMVAFWPVSLLGEVAAWWGRRA